MTVDNFALVLPLLKFESEDDFYYLQILQRKKENPHLGSNSRVIKNYYIGSKEYLMDKYSEIVELCKTFNARASLRLNKRSYRKVAFKNMINVANNVSNGDYLNVKKCYDRACGQNHNDSNKKWILDVDEELTQELLNIIEGFTLGVRPDEGKSKIITTLPSKSGSHVITSPFDLRGWKEQFPDIEIHKDNPVNLYIP